MPVRNSPVRVRAGAVIRKDGKVLLIKSAKGPFIGKWGIPAGGIEEFEPVEKTAVREAKEETGLDVKITGLNMIIETRVKKCADPSCNLQHHAVSFFFDAEPVSSKIQLKDDGVEDLRWFSEKELKEHDLHPMTDLIFKNTNKGKFVSIER